MSMGALSYLFLKCVPATYSACSAIKTLTVYDNSIFVHVSRHLFLTGSMAGIIYKHISIMNTEMNMSKYTNMSMGALSVA